MLTSGELTLLAPLFGFLGVIAGAWVTSASARRQQRFEAFQQRYDRRLEVYENAIVGMSKSTVNLERRLTKGEEPPQRDEQTERTEGILSARVRLLCSDDVRAALNEWAKVFSRVFQLAEVPQERRELARLKHLSEMGEASLKVTRAMAADLDKLSALSPRRKH